MVVVMYGGLKLMLVYDFSPFGLHRIMCNRSGPILKETAWADSAGQLFVVFVLSYIFAGVHHLHYIIFNFVVDFLAKHAIVAKSNKQILTLRKLLEILNDMNSKIEKERADFVHEYCVALKKNSDLSNTIQKMTNEQIETSLKLCEAKNNAKTDLCFLRALIKKFLQEKSPQHLYEWSEVLEVANSNISSKNDAGKFS